MHRRLSRGDRKAYAAYVYQNHACEDLKEAREKEEEDKAASRLLEIKPKSKE